MIKSASVERRTLTTEADFDIFRLIIFLFEERAYRHGGILGDTTVVAFAAAAFAGKHGLGAGFVLLELQVLVDGEGVGHGLNVEVVGADEREGPVLLLQFLNHRADHLQERVQITLIIHRFSINSGVFLVSLHPFLKKDCYEE